jgi:hypothetical protein
MDLPSFSSYADYWRYIQSKYTEEEQISIENFISYYVNKINGFGKKNCEETFAEEKRNDKNGELHSLAMIGVEFEKKIFKKKKSKFGF